MNFATVKGGAIPDGVVKQIACDGVVLWKKSGIIVDDTLIACVWWGLDYYSWSEEEREDPETGDIYYEEVWHDEIEVPALTIYDPESYNSSTGRFSVSYTWDGSLSVEELVSRYSGWLFEGSTDYEIVYPDVQLGTSGWYMITDQTGLAETDASPDDTMFAGYRLFGFTKVKSVTIR
jgi:hypothetical protein